MGFLSVGWNTRCGLIKCNSKSYSANNFISSGLIFVSPSKVVGERAQVPSDWAKSIPLPEENPAQDVISEFSSFLGD